MDPHILVNLNLKQLLNMLLVALDPKKTIGKQDTMHKMQDMHAMAGYQIQG